MKKNLKKVLFLGALLTAMSATAMGVVTNPGDVVEGLENEKSASAGVPMEVRVNIVSSGPELVLVDENGQLIDNLVLDHGTKVIDGDNKFARESRVEKTVILKRLDGKPFTTGNSGKTLTAKFDLESPSYTESTGVFQLTKLNSGNTAKTLNTEIEFINNNITINEDDNTTVELRTPVISTIPVNDETVEAGLYVGTGTFIGTISAATSGGGF